MKLGLIARADNSGLGTMSWEFFKHLNPRTLVFDNGKYASFPDRFPGARITKSITKKDMDWLFEGIDTLLAIETPYDWDVFAQAKKRKIKTVLIPMYECEPYPLPVRPDLCVCPSKVDYDIFSREVPSIELNTPVNTDVIPYRPRTKALVFQHNAGHGGIFGRNGTKELLAAIPLLKSDAKVIIYSQRAIDFTHPKLQVRVGNYEHYWDLWGEGDVFVFPHKFDGLSLPVQEALASGMPVLSTNIYPFNAWLPKEWLFDPEKSERLLLFSRVIDFATVTPETIAKAIDDWYGKDITKDSEWAREWALHNNWQTLCEKYEIATSR